MPTTVSTGFLDVARVRNLCARPAPDKTEINAILAKARELKGLTTEEAAVLLNIDSVDGLKNLMETARYVKQEIYGRRMVLFAPLYTGNHCVNNCLYCGFRKDNDSMHRISLGRDEILRETEAILKSGHKRILMLCGESNITNLDSTVEAIETAYGAEVNGASIKRINVEIAPLSRENFKRLKSAKIGTYICFQETYDPDLYPKYHPSGPKADYLSRLTVMHRAMEAGIDDVGVGILFGLADYKFEVLALMEHAASLEKNFGCGPHTVSVPRIEPAPGAPLTSDIPYPVSDEDFKKIIAVIRISMPYTGIILSTRENQALRTELFHYGVSQISAGSITNPGGYSKGKAFAEAQFALGDHRSLEEVIGALIDDGLVPSFCTGCYRQGRVGADFMDLAKPGLIKQFCLPNGLTSFAEYLTDFASDATRTKGLALINRMIETDVPETAREKVRQNLALTLGGTRDIYL